LLPGEVDQFLMGLDRVWDGGCCRQKQSHHSYRF
jgi:hypothetical protein